MNNTKTFTTNQTTYTTTNFKVGKTEYSVTVATGQIKKVTIRKITANPFGLLGKDFADFNEAISHYKNRSIKLELLKIDLGL